MICTSIQLRASTRVSSGFTLLTCSSPSFGSYHICSFSSPSSENQDWMHLRLAVSMLILDFSTRSGFPTLSLAYRIHSLVRVSRRVGWSRLGRISYRILNLRICFGQELVGEPTVFSRLYSRCKNSFCLLQPKKRQSSVIGREAYPIKYMHTRRPANTIHRNIGYKWLPSISFRLNDFKSFNPLFKVLFIFPS